MREEVLLDAVELAGRDLFLQEDRHPALAGELAGLDPQVEQRPQGHVEEVSAAAGRVEDADRRELLGPGDELLFHPQTEGTGVCVGFSVSVASFQLLGERVEFALHRIPAPAQRFDDDRVDDQADVRLAGVVGTDELALLLHQAALEEGAEDGGRDRAPVQIA